MITKLQQSHNKIKKKKKKIIGTHLESDLNIRISAHIWLHPSSHLSIHPVIRPVLIQFTMVRSKSLPQLSLDKRCSTAQRHTVIYMNYMTKKLNSKWNDCIWVNIKMKRKLNKSWDGCQSLTIREVGWNKNKEWGSELLYMLLVSPLPQLGWLF